MTEKPTRNPENQEDVLDVLRATVDETSSSQFQQPTGQESIGIDAPRPSGRTRTRRVVFGLTALVVVLGAASIAVPDIVPSWLRGGWGRQSTEDAQHSEPAERKILYWYDPMHPSYTSDKPGIAPDCGMKLVPKYADEMEAMKDMAPGTIRLSTEKQQMIGVRTEEAKIVSLKKTIRTVGRIDYDETRIARVHTKIPGWIEKVYVDYVGQIVKKGQPLFTIYSPELVATQEEFLLALKARGQLVESRFEEVARGAESLLASTRRRLELWDITDEQIERLARTGEVQKTLTLYAPVDGVVLKRNAYEQMRITADTNVYEIADLSTIWVYADIYEYEMPLIKEGQPATMKLAYFPGETFRGKIVYVYPYLEGKTRTLKVRMEFPNPDLKLRPDMYADVEIDVPLGKSLVVSEEAVIDTGMRQFVFVDRGNGYFEPRDVKLGLKVDDHYQILEGLKPGERVVTSANFLIDSESRLSAALGGMSHSH